MHTVKLKISDKVYEKFLNALSEFSSEDIIVIVNKEEQSDIQEYLEKELQLLNSGKSNLLSQEEFERRLNEIV